ncbi:hypothetical protein BGZ95_004620, partial [Linnemannia exigua]
MSTLDTNNPSERLGPAQSKIVFSAEERFAAGLTFARNQYTIVVWDVTYASAKDVVIEDHTRKATGSFDIPSSSSGAWLDLTISPDGSTLVVFEISRMAAGTGLKAIKEIEVKLAPELETFVGFSRLQNRIPGSRNLSLDHELVFVAYDGLSIAVYDLYAFSSRRRITCLYVLSPEEISVKRYNFVLERNLSTGELFLRIFEYEGINGGGEGKEMEVFSQVFFDSYDPEVVVLGHNNRFAVRLDFGVCLWQLPSLRGGSFTLLSFEPSKHPLLALNESIEVIRNGQHSLVEDVKFAQRSLTEDIKTIESQFEALKDEQHSFNTEDDDIGYPVLCNHGKILRWPM